MQDETLAIILAGGVGSRLHPLTADRAKPAVPFGGRYRIIDFTLSNCLHSGLRRILVLTQYKSHSLQKHLRDGWSVYNPELGEYITTVPPQMRTGESWYSGTADAIYQNLYLLERSGASHVLILSGDHVYRMDYAAMLRFHHDRRAEATVACLTVELTDARSFGVLQVDEADRITAFLEKPAQPPALPDDPTRALASMGVYVFSMERLLQLLEDDHQQARSTHDFGKDILPSMIASHRVVAYRFGGPMGRVTADRYWRDVGTIDAYYEANMDLLRPMPAMDLYQGDWPIRTYEGQHPPARSVPGASQREAEIVNCMLASGTLIVGATVRHSILFPSVRVDEGATVDNSLLFEDVMIGAGAHLQRCIVDKRVRIPEGERIGFDRAADAARFTVRGWHRGDSQRISIRLIQPSAAERGGDTSPESRPSVDGTAWAPCLELPSSSVPVTPPRIVEPGATQAFRGRLICRISTADGRHPKFRSFAPRPLTHSLSFLGRPLANGASMRDRAQFRP